MDLYGYAVTPFFSQTLTDQTFQIQPIGTFDSGSDFVDLAAASAATVTNMFYMGANAVLNTASLPLRATAAAFDTDVETVDNNIMTAIASSGHPGLVATGSLLYSPFRASSYLHQLSRALSKTKAASQPSLTTERLIIAQNKYEVEGLVDPRRINSSNVANSSVAKSVTQLDELRLSGFNPYDNPKLQKMSSVDQKAFLKEYDKQLRGQQAALNSMTADEFKIARDAYQSVGRNPEAMAMQRQKGRQFENEVADSIREKLVAGGMDAREARTVAKARAKEIRSNLAALHEPDMVAGGWAAPAPTRMGDSVVNSSIGASWSSKLPAIDEMAANAIANGNGGAQLNIRLELLRGANN